MRGRMDFMKRALQRQRDEARQEAQKLIQALQEEKDFDDEGGDDEDEGNDKSEKPEKLEKPEKEEGEESSSAAAIREALSGGVVRRAKHEGKSLQVKDPITVKPLFEPPAIPSMFDDDSAMPSSTHQNSAIPSSTQENSAMPSSTQENSAMPKDSRSHLLDELSDAEAESEGNAEADEALLNAAEPAGENPWLAAARDNVSRGERGPKEAKEEDGVDVQAAVARLEVGKLGKPDR